MVCCYLLADHSVAQNEFILLGVTMGSAGLIALAAGHIYYGMIAKLWGSIKNLFLDPPDADAMEFCACGRVTRFLNYGKHPIKYALDAFLCKLQ